MFKVACFRGDLIDDELIKNADIIFYCEKHTKEDISAINEDVIRDNTIKPFDYILMEELGRSVYNEREELLKDINSNAYLFNNRPLYLITELNKPLIGIDYHFYKKVKNEEEEEFVKNCNKYDKWKRIGDGPLDYEIIDGSYSFNIREKRMLDVIEHYSKLGRIAVIVGSAHLRMNYVEAYGNISPLFKANLGNTIYKYNKEISKDFINLKYFKE